MSGRKPGVLKDKPSNTSGIHKGFEAENCWSPCCKARAVNPLPTMWPSDWDKDAKKGRLTHHLTEDNSRKARPPPQISLCSDPKARLERLIYKPAHADKRMLILTCSWLWLSYYQEGPLKRVQGRREVWMPSEQLKDHLQPGCHTYSLSLSPSAEPPFSSPLIGPLIILSHR